jgi:hypothetical protein
MSEKIEDLTNNIEETIDPQDNIEKLRLDLQNQIYAELSIIYKSLL